MGARIRAFAAFWYDFVIGDDWLVAAGVVISLALTYAALPDRRSRLVAGAAVRGAAAADQPMAGDPAGRRHGVVYRLSASSAYTRAAKASSD